MNSDGVIILPTALRNLLGIHTRFPHVDVANWRLVQRIPTIVWPVLALLLPVLFAVPALGDESDCVVTISGIAFETTSNWIPLRSSLLLPDGEEPEPGVWYEEDPKSIYFPSEPDSLRFRARSLTTIDGHTLTFMRGYADREMKGLVFWFTDPSANPDTASATDGSSDWTSEHLFHSLHGPLISLLSTKASPSHVAPTEIDYSQYHTIAQLFGSELVDCSPVTADSTDAPVLMTLGVNGTDPVTSLTQRVGYAAVRFVNGFSVESLVGRPGTRIVVGGSAKRPVRLIFDTEHAYDLWDGALNIDPVHGLFLDPGTHVVPAVVDESD